MCNFVKVTESRRKVCDLKEMEVIDVEFLDVVYGGTVEIRGLWNHYIPGKKSLPKYKCISKSTEEVL